MKKWVGAFFLFTVILFGWSNFATAARHGGHAGGHMGGHVGGHVGGHWGGYPGGFRRGWYGGYPWAYGYWGWPNYSRYPYGYGYSFYPYFPRPYYSTYAAISYSRSEDLVGYSFGQYSLSSAVSRANYFCGEKDCKSVIWVRGGCAAFTTNEDDDRVGYAYASNRWLAEQNAMRACESGSESNPKACKQRAWVCSF